MKRKAIALFVGLLVLGAGGPAFASDPTLLIDYVGFDYENPDPNPATFGETGAGYVSIGEVPGLFAPLVPDFANKVYTYYIHGSVSTGQTPVGPYVVVNYSPGILEVWEDDIAAGTAFDYGTNPPNATAPGTFTDGTLFVSGPLTDFQFVFNTTSSSGSFEGTFEVAGGSQLANVPANQRLGWTFAGATANALNIPVGYAHQIDGQVFLNKPVPAQAASWGRIKANYR